MDIVKAFNDLLSIVKDRETKGLARTFAGQEYPYRDLRKVDGLVNMLKGQIDGPRHCGERIACDAWRMLIQPEEERIVTLAAIKKEMKRDEVGHLIEILTELHSSYPTPEPDDQ